MKKKMKLFVGLASVAVLAACSAPNTSDNSDNTENKQGDILKNEFPTVAQSDAPAISGGTLRVANVTDSPMEGLFTPHYYTTNPDSKVIDWNYESLFEYDADYKLTDKGMATLTVDADKKIVTVKLKEGLKWSDGADLTIDDYIYAFEVMGHKDFTNQMRYDSTMETIVGMKEYHEGKADTISGIKKIDDLTVEFEVVEITDSLLQAGGFYAYPAPKHQWSSIPISEQAASDAVRKNPVSNGAYRIVADTVISGESATLEANPYYWKGKPKLDKVVVDVVNTTNSAEEFRNGNYDIMDVSTQTAIYDSFKDLDNATLVGDWTNVISYIGFKFGKHDAETNRPVVDENAKMADVNLRKAMAHAVNIDEYTSQFYGTLRSRATTLIPPTFANLRNNKVEGFKYDPEKAKKLLDDAGYKDVDGDNIREDKQGNKLTINFLSMSGGSDAESMVQYLMQQWKEVGLDVQLVDGRLYEIKTFYSMVEKDDPKIDVYQGAWGTGLDPNPRNLWGETSSNYTRFASPDYAKILEKLGSIDMLDTDKKVAAYGEWQEFVQNNPLAIPTQYRVSLLAVNKRVKYYNIDSADEKAVGWNRHLIEVTADKPVASNN